MITINSETLLIWCGRCKKWVSPKWHTVAEFGSTFGQVGDCPSCNLAIATDVKKEVGR